MRLLRYSVGAFILAVLAILFGHNVFEQQPLLAVVLSAAFVLLTVYGGILKYRRDG